ncbi:heavy metal-responsive transcriptional regulator [Luteitalea sp.]|jgi:Hg(II)-responsive transcriptional regulator|uniref:heavy metal-responsive transcriptional regulator n=1 Tax=Luteitalea sp. TaxID=2004800 RepID=UPI0025C02B81|nr:heavy metal-responsive transcriptional regulator [Luteitalea sp.]
MQTGEVAARAGVNIQTLRYYERRGLLGRPPRTASGYRRYSEDAVRIVRFVKRAQELGFTLDEAEQLLRLRRVSSARQSSVRALATAKVADIESKMRQLAAMRAALQQMLSACCGDGALECPILEALERDGDA